MPHRVSRWSLNIGMDSSSTATSRSRSTFFRSSASSSSPFIIAGVVLNTVFLVREIRRNERQDSFLNAVTHELKTPIASIRLYLETLHAAREVDRNPAAGSSTPGHALGHRPPPRHGRQVLKAPASWASASPRNLKSTPASSCYLTNSPARVPVRTTVLQPPPTCPAGSHPACRRSRARPSNCHVSGNPDRSANRAPQHPRQRGQVLAHQGAAHSRSRSRHRSTTRCGSVLIRIPTPASAFRPRELKRVFSRFYRVNLNRTCKASRAPASASSSSAPSPAQHGGDATRQSVRARVMAPP